MGYKRVTKVTKQSYITRVTVLHRLYHSKAQRHAHDWYLVTLCNSVTLEAQRSAILLVS